MPQASRSFSRQPTSTIEGRARTRLARLAPVNFTMRNSPAAPCDRTATAFHRAVIQPSRDLIAGPLGAQRLPRRLNHYRFEPGSVDRLSKAGHETASSLSG